MCDPFGARMWRECSDVWIAYYYNPFGGSTVQKIVTLPVSAV